MSLKQKALKSLFAPRAKVRHSSMLADIHLRNINGQLDAFEAADPSAVNCYIKGVHNVIV